MRNYFKVEQDGYDGFYLDLQHEFPKLTPAKALTLSIAKWQFICDWLAENKEVLYDEGGGETCALCGIALDCFQCVIGKTTDEDNCEGTPYHKFRNAKTHATQLKYARAELAFLQSLQKHGH